MDANERHGPASVIASSTRTPRASTRSTTARLVALAPSGARVTCFAWKDVWPAARACSFCVCAASSPRAVGAPSLRLGAAVAANSLSARVCASDRPPSARASGPDPAPPRGGGGGGRLDSPPTTAEEAEEAMLCQESGFTGMEGGRRNMRS